MVLFKIPDTQNLTVPYERYLADIMSEEHEMVFINLYPDSATEEIEDVMYNQRVRQILVSVPDFFVPSGADVWKYTGMQKAIRMIAGWTPDLILMHDWFWAPVLYSYGNLPPVIYICHLFSTALGATLGYPFENAEISERRAMIHIADYIIGNSKATANDIGVMIPEVRGKLDYTPLGVNKERYRPMPNLDSKVILYMGRLDAQKGIREFLADVDVNFELLRQNGFEVWIAGNGEELSQVVDMHYSGKLKYLYQVSGERKTGILAQAKYMVFPSVYEPWGLSLNEGLATGKICFATPAGGHAEQIQNGKNGVIVEDGKWAEHIIAVEKNPRLQAKLVKNAVSSAYDIRYHFKKLMEVINAYLSSVRAIPVGR